MKCSSAAFGEQNKMDNYCRCQQEHLKYLYNMEKKIITESEMKELLESKEILDNHCVDLETARKIIMDAILPLCK